jgi:HNH endonuclease
MLKASIKSGYYGVSDKGSTYEVFTSIAGKYKYIGKNKDALIAAQMYDKFVIENKLDKHLNFPIYPENLIPNTKQIALTQGKFAIVDESNFEWLNSFKWSATFSSNIWYATRRINKITVPMHRFIMEPSSELYVDHINGNGLHNTIDNLRVCTNSQNGMNRGSNKNTSSIYKGVSWAKKSNKWSVQINKDNTIIHQAFIKDEKEAAMLYNTWAIEVFGEFAWLNTIE